MKSPFPGMDPYIEARGLWEDFHDRLIVELANTLNSRLPSRYEALLAARTYIDIVDPVDGLRAETFIKPDVRIDFQPGRSEGTSLQKEGNLDTATSVIMHPEMKVEENESFVEIWDTVAGDRVITCIEVLSPTNKRPGTPGWGEYERKRQLMFQGTASFVEIDLLRGGRRRNMREPWPQSPYYILLMRQDEAPRCHVFPAFSTVRLPTIPIPLSQPDPDLLCDLQAVVDTVLSRSRYERRLRYAEPIEPALSAAERRFVPNAT